MAFNWRDYIDIDRKFGDKTQFLEHALDRIAQTPEGQELILKAYKRINDPTFLRIFRLHQPRNIEIEVPPMGIAGLEKFTRKDSKANQLNGDITFNFMEVGSLIFETNQRPSGYAHTSVTSVLVHELFHLADPRVDPFRQERVMTEVTHHIVRGNLSESQRNAVLNAIEEVFKDHPEAIHDQEALQRKHAEIARISTIPADTFTLHAISKEELGKAQAFFNEIEEDATQYTDAFMFKYFNEPSRRRYANTKESNSFAWIISEFSCGKGPIPKFEAETIDGIQQPRIFRSESCQTIIGRGGR